MSYRLTLCSLGSIIQSKEQTKARKENGDLMKKAKNVKVGDVVQFPAFQFSQIRSGWNGCIYGSMTLLEVKEKNEEGDDEND